MDSQVLSVCHLLVYMIVLLIDCQTGAASVNDRQTMKQIEKPWIGENVKNDKIGKRDTGYLDDPENTNVDHLSGSSAIITPQTHRSVLQPFYDLTQFFLGSVLQPNTIESLAESIDIDNSDTFATSYKTHTSEWLLYLLGYVILLSIGVIAIFAVPIAGICFLSCRCCCKKCCLVSTSQDGKSDKCKRVCLGSMLTITIVFVIFSVILASMACTDLWHETKEQYGAVDQAEKYLKSFEGYINDTTYDLDVMVNTPFDMAQEEIYYTLDNLGMVVVDTLGNITGITNFLDRMTFFAYQLDELLTLLQQSEQMRETLVSNSSDLDIVLTDLKSNIIVSADLCQFIQECAISKQMAEALTIAPDYSTVSEFTSATSSINFLVLVNTELVVNVSVSNFHNIASIVNSTWAIPVTLTSSEIDQITADISEHIDKMGEYLEQFDISNVTDDINSAKSDVEKFGDVWFFVNISSCLVLLLISLIYITGQLSSICLKVPSSNTDFCTTRITGNILLVGAGLTFLFTWFIFLLTTGMFLLGGLGYTEICRHAININDSTAIDVLSQLLSTSFGNNANVSIKELLNNCYNNKAIYTALELDKNGINITALLDLDQYPLDGLLQNFKDINVDLGSVILLTEELNDTLLVGAGGLDSINTEISISTLAMNVTTTNLLVLAEQLENTADALSIPSLANDFRSYATLSRSYYYTYIEFMDQTRNELLQNIEYVDYVRSETNIAELVVDLTYAQSWVNLNGSTATDEIVYSSVSNLYVTLEDLVQTIEDVVRNSLGQCRPVYESYTGLVDIVCVDVLDPWNLIWLTKGLALLLLMPCLFCAIKLSNMYRKTICTHSMDDVPLNNAPTNSSQVTTSHTSEENISSANLHASSPKDHKIHIPMQDIAMNDLNATPDNKARQENDFGPNKNADDNDDDDAISIASDTSSVSEYMFMSLPKQPLIPGRPLSSASRASRSKAPPPPNRHNKEELIQYLDMFS